MDERKLNKGRGGEAKGRKGTVRRRFVFAENVITGLKLYGYRMVQHGRP